MSFAGRLDGGRRRARSATGGTQPWGLIMAGSRQSECAGREASGEHRYFPWDSRRNQACCTTCYCPPGYKPPFSVPKGFSFLFLSKNQALGVSACHCFCNSCFSTHQLCLATENKYRPKHIQKCQKVSSCLRDNLPAALSFEGWKMFFENFFIIFLPPTGERGLLLRVNS